MPPRQPRAAEVHHLLQAPAKAGGLAFGGGGENGCFVLFFFGGKAGEGEGRETKSEKRAEERERGGEIGGGGGGETGSPKKGAKKGEREGKGETWGRKPNNGEEWGRGGRKERTQVPWFLFFENKREKRDTFSECHKRMNNTQQTTNTPKGGCGSGLLALKAPGMDEA